MRKSRNPVGRRRSTINTSNAGHNSGLKLNQSIGNSIRARKAARSTRKAEYLSTLPKEPWKRVLYRLHPKRVAKYWFSREGAIMALKITGIGIVAMFLIIVGLFAYFRKDLPKIKDLNSDKIGGSITYYDRTGKTVLWQDYGAVKRSPVDGQDISKYMKQATVAVEDKDFYNHGAFDVRGIIRAGLHDVLGGGGQQGGSTITQQLVKNDQGWTYDHSYSRKAKEIILGVELEREYSKDDILNGYLNIAPYGNVDRGVEAAARDYFGVSAKDLTLAQAAMLAAIPKAPTSLSPFSDPKYNQALTTNEFDKEALVGRQQYILDKMVEQKMISKDAAAQAKKVDIVGLVHPLAPSKYDGIKAPYFVLAAKDEVEQKLGSSAAKRGGLKVTTTLNMDLQNLAQKQIDDGIAQVRRQGGDDAALVAEDVKTGQIVSSVGGPDFNNADYGKLNFAHSVAISPGSTFKPYDATAFINNNNNVGAGSVLNDSVGKIPGYPCDNKTLPKLNQGGNCLYDYDFINPGPTTLRYALGGSRNIPWVKAMLSADPTDTSTDRVKSINKTIDTAKALMDNSDGYLCYPPGTDVFTATAKQSTQCYGSSAIGDGAYVHLDDHVNGLASISRLGVALPKTYLLKITDASGKDIALPQPKGKQVVKADAAYIVDNMASDPNASYLTGINKFHRYKGWDFAVKTGTTNFGYDGLMASWSSQYAVATWVGYHTRTKVMSGFMETMTAPIVRGWMQGAHDMIKTPPVNWQQPSTVKSAPAFVQRTHIHYGDVEPGPSTDLFPGWYVGNKTTTNTSQTLDKVSGKVATSCTPSLAKDIQSNSNVATWNVDMFSGGKPNIGGTTNKSTSTSPAATDDVHNCNDPPPLVSVSVANNSCNVTCKVTVTASQQAGGHPLSGGNYNAAPAGTITVQLGGQSINTTSIPSNSSDVYSYSFDYQPSLNQTAALTASVVDSVLYQGNTSSDQITFAVAVSNPSLSGLQIDYIGNTTNAKISWSGGTGPYTVYKSSGNSPLTGCNNVATGQSCTTSIARNTDIYVQDSSQVKVSGNTGN